MLSQIGSLLCLEDFTRHLYMEIGLLSFADLHFLGKGPLDVLLCSSPYQVKSVSGSAKIPASLNGS